MSTSPAPRDRSRLRILVPIVCGLAAAVVVAAWLLTVAARAREQRAAAEAIRALRGVVGYDYLVDFYRREESLGRERPEFKKIENLIDRFPQPDPGPDGLAWIRRIVGPDFLHHVVRINLAYHYDEAGRHNDNRADAGGVIRYFATFPRLQSLLLARHQATDEALRAIRGLREIREIYLWEAEVTDAGVEHLRGMPKLRYVHLNSSKITDRSLELLGTIPTLEGLSLQYNRFTDRGLAQLKGLEKLTQLWVCAPEINPSPDRISDAGLAHLRGLKHLKELGIQHTIVTDAGLEHLKGLTRLKRLYLGGTRVTQAGIDAIERAVPGLYVHR